MQMQWHAKNDISGSGCCRFYELTAAISLLRGVYVHLLFTYLPLTSFVYFKEDVAVAFVSSGVTGSGKNGVQRLFSTLAADCRLSLQMKRVNCCNICSHDGSIIKIGMDIIITSTSFVPSSLNVSKIQVAQTIRGRKVSISLCMFVCRCLRRR